jgi:hypothetical protein
LALEELFTSFFYGSVDAIGVLFPEDIGDALAHNALALACEAVRVFHFDVRHSLTTIHSSSIAP